MWRIFKRRQAPDLLYLGSSCLVMTTRIVCDHVMPLARQKTIACFSISRRTYSSFSFLPRYLFVFWSFIFLDFRIGVAQMSQDFFVILVSKFILEFIVSTTDTIVRDGLTFKFCCLVARVFRNFIIRFYVYINIWEFNAKSGKNHRATVPLSVPLHLDKS